MQDDELAFRRPGRPTANQRARFLELRTQGVGRQAAARLVGTTASRIRAEEKRNPIFARWVAEAEEAGEGQLEDTIRGAMQEVALGHVLGEREEHPKAWEALRMLAEAHLSELQYKRNRQVTHDQAKPFEILVGQRVPEDLLAALTQEERTALLETVRMLETRQRQHLRAIEGGRGEG